LAAAGQGHGVLGGLGVALLLAQQGQGQQWPRIPREIAGQLQVEGRGFGLLPLLLQQIRQQHADGQCLGLGRRFACFFQQRLELGLGLAAAPLLQLQQGEQLQGLDAVGFEVEHLAQLPFGAAAVVAVAAQLRQQHPQLPLLGLLIRQLLQQGGGLLLLAQHQQQLQQPRFPLLSP